MGHFAGKQCLEGGIDPRSFAMEGQQDHVPGTTLWEETDTLPYPFPQVHSKATGTDNL